MDRKIFIKSTDNRDIYVWIAEDGIWYVSDDGKGSQSLTKLSGRIAKDVMVLREPDPYWDGKKYMRVIFKDGTKIDGTPGVIASELTHLNREHLAQALQLIMDETKPTTWPRVPGFYLDKDGIFYADEKRIVKYAVQALFDINESEIQQMDEEEIEAKVKEATDKLKEKFVPEFHKLSQLLASYPDPAKALTVFAGFISLFFTPVRKALRQETPGLLLYGEARTGKTTLCDILLRGMWGLYPETGASAHTPSRFAMLAQEYPIVVVDEAEKLFRSIEKDSGVFDVFKNVHTSAIKARSARTKDLRPLSEWARAGFVYITNPEVFNMDEGIRRRLIAIYFSPNDIIENKKPIPHFSLKNLMRVLILVVIKYKHEILEKIRSEETEKDFIRTGTEVMRKMNMHPIADRVEEFIEKNPVTLQTEDIYHSDHRAVAEIMHNLAQITRRAETLEEVKKEIEKMTLSGLLVRNGMVCITKNYIANLRHQIKMARLARLLQEQGFKAKYDYVWIRGKSARAVMFPIEDLIPREETLQEVKPSQDSIQHLEPDQPLPF